MLHLLRKNVFQNRPNCGKMKEDISRNDKHGVFLAPLGLFFKENLASQKFVNTKHSMSPEIIYIFELIFFCIIKNLNSFINVREKHWKNARKIGT